MQVFIVMIETQTEASWYWNIDRVFHTMSAAKDYIAQRKNAAGYYDHLEFDISVEEVYA